MGRVKWLYLHMIIGSFSLVCIACAGAQANTNDCGNHPFPPFLIKLTELMVAFEASSQSSEIGDFMSGAADAIDQGHYPDCWFESSVGAVAQTQRGQELISKMITGSPSNNTFTVAFPDDTSAPVAITTQECAGLKLKDSGEWAKILEGAAIKRFPELKQGKAGLRRLMQKEQVSSSSQIGLKAMTGRQPMTIQTASTSEEGLARLLSENMRLQLPTVAGSYEPNQMPDPNHIVLVPNHCYAVLAFDASRHLVTLRNPWGKNSSPNFPFLPLPGQTAAGISDIGGGIIRMNLSQFKKYIRGICWSPTV